MFFTVPTGPGFLYLLHFEARRHHAGHYLGSSIELFARLAAHANGRGACITRALADSDEHWRLAALFLPRPHIRLSIRELERRAKLRHSGGDYCPICRSNYICPTGTVSYPAPSLSSRDFRQKEPNEWTRHIGSMIAVCSKTPKKDLNNSQILLLE